MTPLSEGAEGLAKLLEGRRVLALTGAGCSTESGIPDYRGQERRERVRAPVQYRAFVSDPGARARYWSRSAVGWPRFSRARPNPAHDALARLEAWGAVLGVLTQNVDGLHQEAGSRAVLELHGSLFRVRCLDCGAPESREEVQGRILAANPALEDVAQGARAAPDGDAELDPRAPGGFRVPPCLRCGGILKPDVVFFGENVPRRRVDRAWRRYEEAEVLLVVGSSLEVFSGRRFVLRAVRDGIPVAIVNLGPTRGDEWAALRVEGRAGEVLPQVSEALGVPPLGSLPIPRIPRRPGPGIVLGPQPGGLPA